MRRRLILLLAVLALVAAACGSGGEGEGTETTAGGDGDTTTTAVLQEDMGSLLDTVKARGKLVCGVNNTLPGFGFQDETGAFTGFDVDLCRAVAAAVFGDAEAVEFVPLTAAERFEAVTSGRIDLLSRNTTWTQSRDTDLGLDFAPTTYYDGQQIMGRAADGFTADSQVADIAGATICTNAGTTTEKNITEAAQALGIQITLNTFEDFNQVMEQFKAGACDLVTTDGSGLIARKFTDQPPGEEWVIFPARPISKEPLGPAYISNDSTWGDVVNWTIFAMIIAEEKGITSANVDEAVANPPDGEAGRLLGASEDEIQTKMGLSADAFYQVIKQIGNYGELFEKHLTPLGVERGLNALWTDGGLIYAPPAR